MSSPSVYLLCGSPAIQAVIIDLAARHGLDLTARESHLRLEQPNYMPLVIEKIGAHLISIAHYYYQNGDAIADPDVVLFTNRPLWVPIEVQMPILFRRFVKLSHDSDTITEVLNLRMQRDLATFCADWAASIKGEQWLERGVKA